MHRIGSATDNGYGVAPYLGLSISLFEGYGSPHSNPFRTPGVTGSFGSTISALQIFADGLAGGSASFSSNDSVGDTTGVTENDCDTQLTQESNFGDGTSNNKAAIVHPSLTCGDAAAGAAFTIDTVQFGATDTSDYAIVSGLAAYSDRRTARSFGRYRDRTWPPQRACGQADRPGCGNDDHRSQQDGNWNGEVHQHQPGWLRHDDHDAFEQRDQWPEYVLG